MPASNGARWLGEGWRIFRTAPLGLQDLGLTALAAFVIVPVITVEKWVRSRLGARRG